MTVAHRQIADTVCMQAGYSASVIPDGVIIVYFFHVQLGVLDETCNFTKNESLQSDAHRSYPHSCAYSEHTLRSYVHDPVQSPLNDILSL